jgi:Flp pilus assembly protein TadB
MAVLTALLCAAAVFAWVAPPINIALENSILGTDVTARAQKMHLNIDIIPLIRLRALLLSIGVIWAIAAGFMSGITSVILPVALMLVGWKLTDNYLNTLQKRRQDEIAREFPLFVNMIRVFSKASDLYIAINTARQLLQGELRRQLDIMMQEMQTNSVKDSLRRMAERCNYTPMNSLVSVLISGIETGSDIDEILGTFAKRVYETKVNEAKRKVKSQPVIMSILPVLLGLLLLIVFIYPLFIDIIKKLSF